MDRLTAELTLAEREGANYRYLAIALAVRLAGADPAGARRMADRLESEGDAGKHIAAILREDAEWSEGLDVPPMKLAG